MALVTPDGLPVDCGLALDDKTNVALLPVEEVRGGLCVWGGGEVMGKGTPAGRAGKGEGCPMVTLLPVEEVRGPMGGNVMGEG
jgi:hypothetical protein